jgi:hypothetical protein
MNSPLPLHALRSSGVRGLAVGSRCSASTTGCRHMAAVISETLMWAYAGDMPVHGDQAQ